MILVTKWFGSFLCEEGKVRKAALFPKDPEQIARRLGMMREGQVLEEEASLASSARQVVDRRLKEFGKVARFDSSFIKPESYGFTLDIYREATIVLAKAAVKSSVSPDMHLGQAVRAYDDLVDTINTISLRLHEWYGLHFPELENVTSMESFAKAISDHGSRQEVLVALDLRMDSIGSEIAPEDLASIRTLAASLVKLMDVREATENYIELRMQDVAPNITALVGPVIGARLIMQAGGLKRLATLPASTVQLLGAEKAMFRHLKKGAKPPKHGILFQHSWVHSAPMWQRGPIARALATKLCIAARADAYTRSDLKALLTKQLDKRLAEIRKVHANPPKKRPGGQDRRRR